MLYFSSLLQSPRYRPAADNLFAALDSNKVKYDLLSNTRDIWLRDFMPVRRKDGKYISFRYEPSYLRGYPNLRTNFRDIAKQVPVCVEYSDINLDGGNVIFSPSRDRAIVSDRAFAENPQFDREELIRELEELLTAQVIVIPSLSSDMTGHADGTVRFLDGNTVIGNQTDYKNGLEQRIAAKLEKQGIRTVPFPYYPAPGISAAGCYLNFLETEAHIFLPVFGSVMDRQALEASEQLFQKEVVPVRIDEIAEEGGCLNCVSWEIGGNF